MSLYVCEWVNVGGYRYECSYNANSAESTPARETADTPRTCMHAMQVFAATGKLLIYSDFFHKVDAPEFRLARSCTLSICALVGCVLQLVDGRQHRRPACA